MKILGFGDCCVDYYIHKCTAYPGGNALNVSVFAKENGVDSGFLGTIGTDRIGQHIIACAKAREIDISHSPIKEGNSGKAAVNIVNGNRTFQSGYFGNEHGVGTLYPPMLSESDIEYIRGFDLVHGSCYAHIENQMVRLAAMEPLLSFDFSSEDKFRTDEYLGNICPSLDFALFSCEHMTDEEIAKFVDKVRKMGCKNVLTTMGARGQRFFSDAGEVYEGKAKIITPVDTMGAGDSFCAAFLAGLLKRGWKKGVLLRKDMVVPALADAAEYSAKNCLIDGSFGNGLEIIM